MRRTITILLTVLFMAPLWMPLVQAEVQSNMACCRRGGTHDCDESSVVLPNDGSTSIGTAGVACPYQDFATAIFNTAALPPVDSSLMIALRVGAIADTSTENFSDAFLAENSVRGPPSPA